MSHCIVLVKQVPDVSKITDNAFDPETGNLLRGKLPTVINDLDAQAIAFASRIRSLSGDKDRIIAVTMGPPAAGDVLRYAMGRTADTAVLLTDRVLGGADTYATASPLAFAVRKVVKDLLGGTDDYFVVAGMQSVDGDTAQVPPQMAEELGLPCLSYATDVDMEGDRLVFSRIVSGGNEQLVPRSLPAVVTVAKYDWPLFPTVHDTRKAAVAEIITWSAADVGAKVVGGKGSKTNVVKVFAPPPTNRRCHAVQDTAEFARLLLGAFAEADAQAGVQAGERPYLLPARRADSLDRSYEATSKAAEPYLAMAAQLKGLGVTDPSQVDASIREKISTTASGGVDSVLEGFTKTRPRYEGDVWVIAEIQDGELHPATLELVGKASELACSLEKRVGVVLLGHDVGRLGRELIEGGADDVHVVDDPLLLGFDPTIYRRVVTEIIDRHWPQIVLFAATPQGRTLAPMVSFRLHCGLTADCTSLEIRDNTRKNEIAILAQTRPALGGNVMATICSKDSKCQMATARPGVMKRLPADPQRTGNVVFEKISLSIRDASVEILRSEARAHSVGLDSPVVVTGGRGLQTRENYASLVDSLATALERRLGVPVGRGASRAAVEAGYTERSHQVGQTGTSVGPRVYVALGVSGAIQHMVGVANSGVIFAINSDPHAPIFKQCDHYLVGKVEDLLPDIVRHLGAN